MWWLSWSSCEGEYRSILLSMDVILTLTVSRSPRMHNWVAVVQYAEELSSKTNTSIPSDRDGIQVILQWDVKTVLT